MKFIYTTLTIFLLSTNIAVANSYVDYAKFKIGTTYSNDVAGDSLYDDDVYYARETQLDSGVDVSMGFGHTYNEVFSAEIDFGMINTSVGNIVRHQKLNPDAEPGDFPYMDEDKPVRDIISGSGEVTFYTTTLSGVLHIGNEKISGDSANWGKLDPQLYIGVGIGYYDTSLKGISHTGFVPVFKYGATLAYRVTNTVDILADVKYTLFPQVEFGTSKDDYDIVTTSLGIVKHF